MNRREEGFSLVEVLIALAITSVVLLTIVTLFYMGRRNVYSGKQMTMAASVGTRVLEDLSSLTADDLRTAFAIDDNTTLGNVTLPGLPPAVSTDTTYTVTDSIKRSTSGCTWTTPASGSPYYACSNDSNKLLGHWLEMVSPNNQPNATLAKPEIGLIITPRSPSDASKPISTCRFYKIRAYISWDNGPAHRRYAFFDTTRVNR